MPTQAIAGLHLPQAARLIARTKNQTSKTWRRLYVPHVGQAVCCNFCCWHCGQVERVAAVVFHWLRRERVFERDIFRFGTGIFLSPYKISFICETELSRIQVKMWNQPISLRETALLNLSTLGRLHGERDHQEVLTTWLHTPNKVLRNFRYTLD